MIQGMPQSRVSIDWVLQARRGGKRLLGFGLALEVVGLLLVFFVDRESGGGVTHATVNRTGYSIPFIAGLPGTIGYLCAALGVYRLATGRGPGNDPHTALAMITRGVFALATVALFFAGTFVIVMKMRG